MSDAPSSGNTPAKQPQISIRVDESKMVTVYANTIRTSTTGDEVILDLGLNLPAGGPGDSIQMIFAVGSRVVMNWTGAKRLMGSLQQIVSAYEQQYGPIEVAPQSSRGR